MSKTKNSNHKEYKSNYENHRLENKNKDFISEEKIEKEKWES